MTAYKIFSRVEFVRPARFVLTTFIRPCTAKCTILELWGVMFAKGVVCKQALGDSRIIMKGVYKKIGQCCWFTALVVYVVWLSGCATMPSAFEQVSWLLSGGSYLTTGKGPSDHVISYLVKKDCSLFRTLSLKPVCIPITDETNQSSLSRTLSKPIDSLPRPDNYTDHRITGW